MNTVDACEPIPILVAIDLPLPGVSIGRQQAYII